MMHPASGRVRVVLDAQVLQARPGAAPASSGGWVAGYGAALAAAGRLAAALLAPELPAPRLGDLPCELLDEDYFQWDCRTVVRRLANAAARSGPSSTLARLVPAPFLHLDSPLPATTLLCEHWAEAALARVTLLTDIPGLRGAGAPGDRFRARVAWVAASNLVLVVSDRVAERAVSELHCDSERVVTIGSDPVGAAERTVLALDEALGGIPGTTRAAAVPAPRPLPPRVALVGPFPPSGGGIGAYNARVATESARRVATDVIATSKTAWPAPSGARKLHIESFGTDARPASYDAVVYTLGNSSGHLGTVEAALRHPGWLWLHEVRLPALATTALESLDDGGFDDRIQCLLERAYPGRPPIGAARRAGRSNLALATAGVGLAAPLVERAAGLLVNSQAARNALALDLHPSAWHPPIHVLPPGCPPVRAERGPREGRLAASFGVVSMTKRPDLLVDAAARAGCDLVFVGPCPAVLQEVINERARIRGVGERVRVTGPVSDVEWWGWMERATIAVQLREHSAGELSAAVVDALSAGLPVLTNLPSARDLPAGTVSSVPGPQPDVVATRLSELFDSRSDREQLSTAGTEYASAHQMSDLADALLEVVLGSADAV